MKLACAALCLLQLLGAASGEAASTDDCSGFQWDISRERALFATTPLPLSAALDGRSPPAVQPDRAYRLQLTPVVHIAFPVAPGKPPSDESYGGVLGLTLPSTGRYRLAVDAPLWIDVVGDGRLTPPTGFEGQHECSAPKKIVEFDLEGSTHWVIQLSGARQTSVGLVVVGTPRG